MLDRKSQDISADLKVVRQAIPHDSAIKHVMGSAPYIDDIPEPQGLLHIAVARAPVAKGKLKKIGLEEVKSYPGVVTVLTASDIPGKNDVGPVLADDPVFVEEDIQFAGQALFAVVAETRLQARKAIKLAKFTVDEEQPILSMQDALANDSKVLPDAEIKIGTAVNPQSNDDQTLTGSLMIGGQDHFYLEGQVALAVPQEDEEVLVYSSTQHPTEVQHSVAKVLGLNDHEVVVEVRRMGGGFGGKESQASQWAAIAALAARTTGRPCKIRLDRDDDMVMTGKRHATQVDYKIVHDSTGVIQFADMDFATRCGYSADLSGPVCDRTMMHADNAYFLPNARIYSKRLKTNTVSDTAFRGFGGPQGMMAIERIIDDIARRVDKDPLDVRMSNLYGIKSRKRTPYNMMVEDNVLPELVSQLAGNCSYQQRREEIKNYNKQSRFLKKGLALTPVKFGISFTATHLNQAGALVHVYSDGSVRLNHGGTEMGQGLCQKVAQVVADEFGLELDKVKITATTTDKVPNTSATAASSGSDMNGMAAKIAAEKVKGRLAKFAATHFGVAPSAVKFVNSQVIAGDKSIAFSDLTKMAHFARVSMSDTGFYATPKIHWDKVKYSGRPFYYFAYGAACSEVMIDILTGEMKVNRVDILHDVGKSLNPAIDIGQIEGGFIQGMGWLTTEELWWSKDGHLKTHAPSTYKIPTAGDVPDIFNVELFENANREDVIHSSKAVGEPPLMLAISVFSAIGDAISSITKYRYQPPLDAPATAEEILKAVNWSQEKLQETSI